jgi:protein gp37
MMANNCKIEWVAELARIRKVDSRSWNPVIGCSRASEGCRNCYAAAMVDRFARKDGTGSYAGLTERDQNGTPRFTGKIDFSEKRLMEPLRWREPAAVFVGDMADLFHDAVTDEMLDRIFAVMALRPDCLFLVLTKRPERMREYLTRLAKREPDPRFLRAPSDAERLAGKTAWLEAIEDIDRKFIDDHGDPVWPLPNVWLGVTAENQAAADERIPHLLTTPAAKRFVSIEPMLGPMTLSDLPSVSGIGRDLDALSDHVDPHADIPSRLDWVICGGESGPGARPMRHDWARSVRDQCGDAGVPFFLKQLGEFEPCAPPIAHPASSTRKGVVTHTWGDGTYSIKVGKKAAGRLLDGREWNEVPQ